MPLSLAIESRAGNRESTKLQQYGVVVLVTLAAFSVGNYLSWTSPALPLYKKNSTFEITEQEGSWVCSLVPLGAVSGTIPAGIIANNIGRKKTILITTVPLLLCWLVIGFADSIAWIFLARFFGGAACGAASVVIPMYVSEIAEPSIRGSLGTIFQLQITLGILFTYVAGFTNNLHAIAALCSLAPGLLLIALPFLPESPAWLATRNKDVTGLRIGRETHIQSENASIGELRNYGRATIITLGLMIFQQLSGVNTLIFYAKTIFELAGSSLNPTVSSVIVGLVQVIATYFSTILIDRAGRKILLFLSASIMAVCMFILSGYFRFQNSHDVSSFSWLPLLSFTVFIVIFSVGFGPIPWMMVGELFTNNVKSAASSMTAICNWTLAFLVTKCFQNMVDLVGISSSFATFGMISLFGTAFVAILVPETKGKTIEEVQVMLYRKNGTQTTRTR